MSSFFLLKEPDDVGAAGMFARDTPMKGTPAARARTRIVNRVADVPDRPAPGLHALESQCSPSGAGFGWSTRRSR